MKRVFVRPRVCAWVGGGAAGTSGTDVGTDADSFKHGFRTPRTSHHMRRSLLATYDAGRPHIRTGKFSCVVPSQTTSQAHAGCWVSAQSPDRHRAHHRHEFDVPPASDHRIRLQHIFARAPCRFARPTTRSSRTGSTNRHSGAGVRMAALSLGFRALTSRTQLQRSGFPNHWRPEGAEDTQHACGLIHFI